VYVGVEMLDHVFAQRAYVTTGTLLLVVPALVLAMRK
jgi:hypothetical protein